jgi:hypothetical protein
MLIRSMLPQQSNHCMVASIGRHMQERDTPYARLLVHIRSFF